MDYPELIAEVTDRTGDSTVATRATMYLRFAEVAINKILTLGENEASDELLTDADGAAILPDDFATVRLVVIGGREIGPVDFAQVTLNPVRRMGYAIRGGKILTTWPNTNVTLYYYAKITPLDLTGTNWLIEADPEVYLYAMMEQVYKRQLDVEKAVACQRVYSELVAQRCRQDAIQRFGKTPYRVVGSIV